VVVIVIVVSVIIGIIIVRRHRWKCPVSSMTVTAQSSLSQAKLALLSTLFSSVMELTSEY
jgi:hypothetical protein